MSNIKEYIPFIIPILAATVGYIFGQRTTKTNRFYTQNENNLKTVIEPLFLSIKVIMRENSGFKRERLLDDLFELYILEEKGLYQIGNKDLIDNFFYVEELYKDFKIEKSEEKWKKFWIALNYYYQSIEGEYWSNFYTLYRNYGWYLYSLNRNIFVRIFFETIRFLKDTVNFLTSLSVGFLVFSLYDKLLYLISDKRIMPEGSIVMSIQLLIFCIALYGFITIFDAFSPNSSQQKSFIDKLIKKYTNEKKKYEKKIRIPKMYE
ncbi:hypothetical protein ACTFPA_26055 [Bacillus cereus group sp. MYBK59-1]|uniref:hypothetical protein n=1 Tax=Bacillus cereus group sp. MYBK59-1 TaxID=3450617 RepID=UPI002A4354A6|nr:hypothetical protein [Bacillus cereus]MDA2135467.1 hypothetical protein [Bacillus cereus]